MQDFEKLGVFYLGRQTDPSGSHPGAPVLYDSRDLVTHAVCVGMTGSGKTGLCISIIEEAALDGVPVIAIDPKGDLSNLLLTFPALTAQDFAPWINEDDARLAGATADAYAQQQADLWKKGLAEWGEDGDRIKRLKAAADFAFYTPASRAGLPISILSSFAAPPASVRDDREAMTERASSTAISILTLAGANAEPRGREHTFVSALFANAWQNGRDLDLASLIQQIQTPPLQTIGVLDVESFFPAKERFSLAMQLNNVLASPGFEQWLEGPPLDPGLLLYGSKGKPRVSVISIAHLADSERMFFVSLLLNQVVAWMRTQTGTTSLRAIVYMDEIAGYLPPVAAPPSKAPMMTLLKQARAFGVGLVLATQNPVDLDYKALSNTGTWFLGRLQTERDKARVLDGIEGAAAGSLDRDAADKALSALGKRVFLLHDVHSSGPITFQTRWTMSYLRGPLSKDQIKTLMSGVADPAASAAAIKTPPSAGAAVPSAAAASAAAPPASTDGSAEATASAPVLPPSIQQYFLPTASPSPRYEAVALGIAKVAFVDTKLQISESRDVIAAAPIGDGAVPVDWTAAEVLDMAPSDLASAPEAAATFGALPKAATQPKNYTAWQKVFTTWLAGSQTLELQRHASSKLTAKPGESERDFAIRVQTAQREARDAEVDDLRKKFESQRARLEDQLRRAQQTVDKEQEQASQQKLQTVVSLGATVVGALFGRKAFSAGTLGRATTAARGFGRASKEADDVHRAQENVDEAKKKLDDLDAQIADETKAIQARYDADAAKIDTVRLAPKRGQISVQCVALGWRAR
jgi:hypothetical protein